MLGSGTTFMYTANTNNTLVTLQQNCMFETTREQFALNFHLLDITTINYIFWQTEFRTTIVNYIRVYSESLI